MRLILILCAIGAAGWVAMREEPLPGPEHKLPPTTVDERRIWLREQIANNPFARVDSDPDCPGRCIRETCFIHFDPAPVVASAE